MIQEVEVCHEAYNRGRWCKQTRTVLTELKRAPHGPREDGVIEIQLPDLEQGAGTMLARLHIPACEMANWDCSGETPMLKDKSSAENTFPHPIIIPSGGPEAYLDLSKTLEGLSYTQVRVRVRVKSHTLR